MFEQCMLFPGISLTDDDLAEFIVIMTRDECIKQGQQLLQENPDAQLTVGGDKEAENKIYEATNKTKRGNHILCAGLRAKDTPVTKENFQKLPEVKSDLCYVIHNDTLANYIAMDGGLKEPSETTQGLIKAIYKSSCLFNEQLDKLVSVKVVEHTDQCHFQSLAFEGEDREIDTTYITSILFYIAVILASVGIIGNAVSLSVHLRRKCQNRQSVYLATKGLSEIFLLACMIAQVSIFYVGDVIHIITMYLYPILFQLSMFSRNWIMVVIGIEKCLAVWAPFFTRAHLGRGLEIKFSLGTVFAAVLFTTCDFLIKHFRSDLMNII